jgi:hypothetical protein
MPVHNRLSHSCRQALSWALISSENEMRIQLCLMDDFGDFL